MEGRFLRPTKQGMNCNLANINDLTFVYTRLSVKTFEKLMHCTCQEQRTKVSVIWTSTQNGP